MARRPRRRDPIPLGGEIQGVLADLGHGAVAEAVRITQLWPEAVGPEIAAQAEPSGLSGRTLEIRARSSAWAQELGLRQHEILSGLRRVLGEDAPDRIRIHVGSRGDETVR